MKVKTIHVTLALIVLTSLITPITEAIQSQWGYDNYLYKLSTISYEDPAEAGRMNSIQIQVGANTEVTAHIEFKGHYSWGEWVYESKEIQLDAGTSTFTTEVEVPFKTIVEPTCIFYYYIYVTLPGESWTPNCWGLRADSQLALPAEISLEDLRSMMSHLAWMVETSTLCEEVKKDLLSKIGDLAEYLEALFIQGDVDKIYEILEFILDFRVGFCSDESKYSDFICEITGYISENY